MLQQYYQQVGGGRTAPQAGPAGQAGYSGFRANQAGLITRLEALASGAGPSLASQQFKEATDRNQASQAGMAASGRGGPMAQFQAANNMALLGSQAAQGSAAARIQEQQMALGLLSNNITAGRSSDENTNQFNVGQKNQFELANMDARLRQMGMDDQTRLQLLSQMGGQNQATAGRVGMGEQILAGGAGLFGMYAGQQAQSKANNGGWTQSGMPGYPQWGNYRGSQGGGGGLQALATTPQMGIQTAPAVQGQPTGGWPSQTPDQYGNVA